MNNNTDANYKFGAKVEKSVRLLILVLWSAIMLFLFAMCIIKTVDVINDMDVYFLDDSPAVNIICIILLYLCTVAAAYMVKRFVPDYIKDRIIRHRDIIGILVTAAVAAFLVCWICITQYEPSSDQLLCMKYANELLEGNTDNWVTGYMSVYPFQNGLVLFDALLIRLFGSNAFVAFQLINVIFFVVAVIAMYISCGYMFKKDNSIIVWLACVLFYPFAMYVVYCYGTMIGFSLACIAEMFLFMYFDKGKLCYIILSGISITLSIIIKSNYAIFLVGILLYLVFHAVTEKSLKSAACAVIVLAVYAAGQGAMDYTVEHVTGKPLAQGAPKIGWVAMGLNDAVNTPGWFDNYNTYVYEKNGRDRDATVKECISHIKQRGRIILETGFFSFYYEKITSQWNNPTWECFNFQSNYSGTPDYSIKQSVLPGNNQIYKDVLDILQTEINFGVLLYIIMKWRDADKASVYELFNAVLMIGGFIFYIIWEAKSQYAAPYYFLIIPYSVMGWKNTAGLCADYLLPHKAEERRALTDNTRKHDRAVCVMCIGKDRYLKQYEIVENQMRSYAARCNADFILIDEWLDSGRKRGIYSQKLLIADYLREYELAAFFDLDVIINPKAPDIFADIPQSCGLAAVVNPRGTDKFKKIYSDNPRVLNETVSDYFTSRGFEVDDGNRGKLAGNINGGVLVFRPSLVADAFRDYYYSGHSQGGYTAYEEAPMAYYAQTHDIFFALDERFNKMLHFESGREEFADIYNIRRNRMYILADKALHKLFGQNNLLLTRKYVKFVQALLSEGAYMVHMSGGFYSAQAAARLQKYLYGKEG